LDIAHPYSGRTVKGSLVPFGTGLSLKFTSCCKAQNMPSSPLQKNIRAKLSEKTFNQLLEIVV
jgi:hypothetical protein